MADHSRMGPGPREKRKCSRMCLYFQEVTIPKTVSNKVKSMRVSLEASICVSSTKSVNVLSCQPYSYKCEPSFQIQSHKRHPHFLFISRRETSFVSFFHQDTLDFWVRCESDNRNTRNTKDKISRMTFFLCDAKLIL